MNPKLNKQQTLATIILIILSLFIIVPVFAVGTLSLDINAVDPDTGAALSGSLQTGELIEYVIDFSCSSTSGTCGNLSIDFPLDSEVIYQEVISPPSYGATYNAGTRTVTVTNIPPDLFDDGEAGQVTVRVRVGQNLDDSVINASITGTISNGPGGNPANVTAPGSNVTIATPFGGWNTTKTKTQPAGTVQPAADGSANYQVAVCPVNPAEGVARLDTITIVDRFPLGATPSNLGGSYTTNANLNGTAAVSDELDSAGRPATDPAFTGLDGVNDTITWTITTPNAAPNDYHTADNGCVNVTYTLTFPTTNTPPIPNFPTGTAIANTYQVSAITPDRAFPANGTCPNCVGTGNTGGNIAPPTVRVETSKSGPGNAVIAPAAPGNETGITPFGISWNLNQANTATNNFLVQDEFPLANGHAPARPIIDTVFFQTGTWSGGYRAVAEYLDSGGTWQTLSTVDGSSNTTYSSTSGTPIPTPIYGARLRFIDAVPAGFQSGSPMVIWFTVPSGLNAAAYTDGTNPYRQYQNCAAFTGTFDNGGTPTNITNTTGGVPIEACTNFRVGEDTTNGFANITTSKTASPAEVFPTQDIQFTLRVDLTQEASGALINPFIQDVLPFGMQIVRVDSVEFQNIPQAERQMPYLSVEQVNTGTNPLTSATNQPVQRLVFFWSNRTPSQLRTDGAFPNNTTASDTDQIFTCASPALPITATTVNCTGTIDTNIANFNLDGSAALANPATANPLTITAPGQNTSKSVLIRFTAQARTDTPAGGNDGNSFNYSNTTRIVTDSTTLVCQSGTGGGADTTDVDRDGNTTETRCDTSGQYRIREAAQIAGTKWIRSVSGPYEFRDSRNLDITSPTCETTSFTTGLYNTGGSFTNGGDTVTIAANAGNPTFTRFPCVAQGSVGREFEYLFRVQNTGLANVNEFILYDILPHETDFGVSQAIANQQRNSEFRTFLIGPIVSEQNTSGAAFVVEYFVGTTNRTNTYGSGIGGANPYNPYRPQMTSALDNPLTDWSTSGLFSAVLPDPNWVLAGAVTDWRNVTAFRIRQTGGVIEPGRRLIFSAPAIISEIDPSPGTTTQSEAETGEIGWNSFSHRYTNTFSSRRLLTAAPRKVGIVVTEQFSVGNRVWIDDGRTATGTVQSQFNNGILDTTGTEPGVDGVIVNLYSRTGNNNFTLYASDVTRNGGYYLFGNLPGGSDRDYHVHISHLNFLPNGWTNASPPVYVSPSDPTGTEPGPLFEYLSSNYIGTNASAGGFNRDQRNDRQNSRDNGRDPALPAPPAGAFDNYQLGSTNLSTGLPNGGVLTREFTLTRNNMSRVDNTLTNGDVLLDGATPSPVDFPSLAAGASPNDPRNEGPYGRGVNNEQDDYSDLTRDFGFYRPMSIGNYVWLDNGASGGVTVAAQRNDGIRNGDEVGIPGVQLQLYYDTNNNGRYDAGDAAVDGDRTTAGVQPYVVTTRTDDAGTPGVNEAGYYLFENLPPGNYIVRIPNSQFSGVLENHLSSDAPATPTDATADNNDSGINPVDGDTTGDGLADTPGNVDGRILPEYDLLGVNSPVIVLSYDSEPDPTGTTPADDDEAVTNTGSDPVVIADDNSDLTVDFGFYVPPMSIGNRVWYDANNNGRIDMGEDNPFAPGTSPAIAGVTLQLYADTNGNGIFDGAATDLPVDNPNIAGTQTYEVTTDAEGYYLFDNLPPGNYFVLIPPTEFNGTEPLSGFISTSQNGGDNQQDSTTTEQPTVADTTVDENGVDPTDTSGNGGVRDEYEARGIVSPRITLTIQDEPLETGTTPAEVDVSGNTTDFGPNGRGRFNEEDNNSDLTIDFGFYRPLSLGNRVWLDDGRTGATTFDVNLSNDGIINGQEQGIAGVTVELWLDSDGNGRFSPPALGVGGTDTQADDPNQAGFQPYVTTTNADGYYLFDGLTPGNYIVHIPPSQFNGGALDPYISSSDVRNQNSAAPGGTAQGDARPDNTDHGVDRVDGDRTGDGDTDDGTDVAASGSLLDDYDALGVSSAVIPLAYDTEPDPAGATPTDDSEAVTGTGRYGEEDDNSDLTVDFGFVEPPMSLGNRVWFDANNNSVLDDPATAAVQPGIPGVRVRLLDVSGNPVQRTNPLTGTLENYEVNTDANGYYLFDNLRPGTYTVEITADNFQLNDGNVADGIDGVGPLLSMVSSTNSGGDNNEDTDVDENGQNPVDGDTDNDGVSNGVAGENGSVLNEYQTYGVRSTQIVLSPTTEPLTQANGEVDIPADDAPGGPNVTAYGPQRRGRTDENDADSNLTVDFGFYRPLSLGNRVWKDDGRTGATTFDLNNRNNGVLDAGELGIAGVRVELYFDTNGDNRYTPGVDQAVDDPNQAGTQDYVTTTNSEGYYLFDGLIEGDYIVHIPAGATGTNFDGGALENLVSSRDAGTIPTDATADDRDSGIDRVDGDRTGDGDTDDGTDVAANGDLLDDYEALGVSSARIPLRYTTEPTGTADDAVAPNNAANVTAYGPERRGRYGELDNNSDLTVDFGFVEPSMSLGNRVWFDANNNGIIDAGDDFNTVTTGDQPGIPGVTVRLLDGTGNPIQRGGVNYEVTTNAEGYYLFDNLAPGNYIVEIVAAEFNGSEQLVGLLNSSVVGGDNTSDTNADENGQNPTDTNSNGSVLDEMAANGIRSSVITLALTTEPLQTGGTATEVDVAPNNAGNVTAYGPERRGRFDEQDGDSNLTVDFGFYRPLSIGNRIWFDTDNNALLDGGEVGINGVLVEIFRDTNNNGTFEPGTDLPARNPNNVAEAYTTVTQSDGTDLGYYIFDGLGEGRYFVRVAARNFQNIADDGDPTNGTERALTDTSGAPYSSSETDNPPQNAYLNDNQTDNNDNGVDENFPQTNGVVSQGIVLAYTTEPDGNTDADLDTDGGAGTSGEGRNGEADNNADMTIDFGFYTPLMSIGNYVFIDYDNDRQFEPNNSAGPLPNPPAGLIPDVGVDGVRLQIFTDTNNDGVPDGAVDDPNQTGTQDYIATTNGGGYYIFDRLTPGRYVVQVLPSNFAAGAPLHNYYSSQDVNRAVTPVVIETPTDNGAPDTPPANANDLIENGIDPNRTSLLGNADLSITGIYSPSINLVPSGEEDQEAAESEEGLQTGVLNGAPNIQDTNSDLTVDFGFYQPMSIGNLVWIDTNNNNVFDPATEQGVSGVRVNLYRDDGDGTFEGGADDPAVSMLFDDGTGNPTMRAFDVTNPEGFYLFDNLPPGDYWVQIDPSNFTGTGALVGYELVTTNTDDGVDNNNNGTLNGGGSLSNLVTLSFGSEVVTETVESGVPSSNPEFYDGPQSYGRFGELDRNSDISVDFGYRIAPVNAMSIGNRVWIDEDNNNGLAATDRNGVIDAADVGSSGRVGVNGVVVLLFADANGDGIPDSDTPIAKDVTSANVANTADGYYLFDVRDTNLGAITDTATTDPANEGDNNGQAITPGRYVIAIPNNMFATGGPLEGYHRSTLTNQSAAPANPDNQIDNDDNGNDTLNTTYGLLSQSFTLTLNGEASAANPPDDTDVSGADDVGQGNGRFSGNNITDNNSELTLDFGFYRPFSLGNRVWIDNNNNGQFDTGDSAPTGAVTLTLYVDTNGSGVFDAGDLAVDNPNVAGIQNYQVSTDTNGYYLFDNLPPGQYFVVIDNTNFDNNTDVLFGYTGSNGASPAAPAVGNTNDNDSGTDGNDNGVDVATPATTGIPSTLITLSAGNEPTNETGSGNTTAHGPAPQNRGRFGELDSDSDLTIDFGLFPSNRFAIGNRVWVDETTIDGVQQAAETGIGNSNTSQGVLMRLYRWTDANGNGTLDANAAELAVVNNPTNPAQPYTVTTDANGYYLFEGLPAGQYVVSVAPENFQNVSIGGAPAVLQGYLPTIKPAGADATNHDTDLQSDHVNTTVDATYGFYSNIYTLEGTAEPTKGTGATNERLPDGTAETAPDGTFNSTAIPDNQSNLTVDFGFYRTLSLGNRVWNDTNGNGTIDATEAGIPGVRLDLYVDTNGNGQLDGGEPAFDVDPATAGVQPYTVTTDAQGFYMFNNLPPGNYIIQIPVTTENFNGTNTGALDPYTGSTTTTTNTPDTTDLNDNGIDPTTWKTNPINSAGITLARGGTPTGETDLGSNTTAYGVQNRGINNEQDNSSDMTWDFGFTSTPYSLGNRVWIDANDNGVFDNGETPVANVTVNLFNQFDANGVPTNLATPYRTVTTDANGYYRFDNIPPDRYVVQIDETEFQGGGDLAGLLSTTTAAGTTVTAAVNTDNADDGIDPVDGDTNGDGTVDGTANGSILDEYQSRGVRSGIIDLTGAQPLNEQSADATTADPRGDDAAGNPIPDAQSNLTLDFGFRTSFDWGDAPDTYGTNSTANDSANGTDAVGPSHRIVGGLQMGATIDNETNGAPVAANADNNSPNGDGTDEDGFNPATPLTAGATVEIEVTVTNTTGSNANLIAWFDWNRNGVFEDSEATGVAVVPTGTNGVVRLPAVTIPNSANSGSTDLQTYARFRLTNDPITSTEPTGAKNSGEVEDYQVTVKPRGLSVTKSDGRNSVVAGQSTTYTITIENTGVNERNDVRFVDDIPVSTAANRNGLVGGTITWTCAATGGASCVNRADPANDPPVTARNGTVAAEAGAGNFEISERIDLPPGSRIVYSVTGTLDAQAGVATACPVAPAPCFTNTATLPQEVPPVTASDGNGVIYDPPSGVKVASVNGNVIRWTMTWYNSGPTQAGVTITDTLQANQSLAASDAAVNLVCTTNTAGGTVGNCNISADRRTITWNGTMATSSAAVPADAVVISFNVNVPGPGTYTNTATLTGFPAPNNAVVAAAAVTINPDGTSAPAGPGPEALDPTIVKRVDPQFALPGETVTWTIIVKNPNPFTPLYGVSWSDNIPAQLEILDYTADTGTVTIAANNVTWEAAIMPPNQEVSVRIRTRLRSDIKIDVPVIINTVVLNTGDTAQAELLTAFELPQTGESPQWRATLMTLLGTGISFIVCLLVFIGRYRLRWRRSNS